MSMYSLARLLRNEIKSCISSQRRLYGLQKLDPRQEEALDQELCILVDEKDKTIGAASKRACHVVGDNGDIPLHRAFSLFLFNTKGEMLMQRRGHKKVTFPNVYTNACCSHPLWIDNAEEDILVACCRRLNHELGIPLDQISPADIKYLTRFHYHHTGDGKWGEHEMDYILFLQKDVYLEPNPDEIDEVRFIAKDKFHETVSKFDAPLSPWFKLVMKHRLFFWWDNLHQLDFCKDQKTIQRVSI